MVFAAFIYVLTVLDQSVANGLLGVSSARTELGEAIDHILDEMKAIHLIKHDHVKRCGRGAFLLVTADVEISVIRPPIGEAVNEPGVTVKGKDDRFVLGENGVEIVIAHAVRMFAFRLELHQIDDVNNADFDFRKKTAKKIDCGYGFKGWNIAAAGHDDVRFTALVVACPFPNADASGAMFDGFVHREPNRGRLFAGDDDVYVISASKAVIGDGKKCIGVGGKIDADDLGLFVYDVVDETGVLVGETVVILPPDVG